MGPFIDTIIICTMTALVILSAGVWNRPPVGTVESINDKTITVKMAQPADLPERLRDAHYAELANEHSELWVLVERVEGDEPKYVTCKTTAFAGKHFGAAMGAHTFDMTPDANVVANRPDGI